MSILPGMTVIFEEIYEDFRGMESDAIAALGAATAIRSDLWGYKNGRKTAREKELCT